MALLLAPPIDAEVEGLRRAVGDGALGRIPAHLEVQDRVVREEGGGRAEVEPEGPAGGPRSPEESEDVGQALLAHVDRRDQREVGGHPAERGVVARPPEGVDLTVHRGRDEEDDAQPEPGHQSSSRWQTASSMNPNGSSQKVA